MSGAGIAFAKMSGSGNDFVVIDSRDAAVPIADVPSFVRAVSRRGVGLGADGVVLIERPETPANADFRWRYINADGTDGEMCGNGAICGARFDWSLGIAPLDCRFETASGLVVAHIGAGDQVELEMVSPGPVSRAFRLPDVSVDAELHAVTVGVPHVVRAVDDVDAFGRASDFGAYGRPLRMHPHFAPVGTNFNLIHWVDDWTIRMRTYERGVEDETLACGTGAVACAVIAVRLGLVRQPVSVITSSGDPLRPVFAMRDGDASDVRLGGQARFIAHGTLDPEGLA